MFPNFKNIHIHTHTHTRTQDGSNLASIVEKRLPFMEYDFFWGGDIRRQEESKFEEKEEWLSNKV